MDYEQTLRDQQVAISDSKMKTLARLDSIIDKLSKLKGDELEVEGHAFIIYMMSELVTCVDSLPWAAFLDPRNLECQAIRKFLAGAEQMAETLGKYEDELASARHSFCKIQGNIAEFGKGKTGIWTRGKLKYRLERHFLLILEPVLDDAIKTIGKRPSAIGLAMAMAAENT